MKLLLTILICILLSAGYAYSQKEDKTKVIKIIDGDTVSVQIGDKYETVRIIGINAPEDTKTKECFGSVATAEVTELLDGQEVILEADPTQADRDRYQRLLRYVFIGDTNVSLYLIENGFAREYTYSKAYKYQKEFRAAEAKAKDQHLGLWNCG